jgi:hypothetical protein
MVDAAAENRRARSAQYGWPRLWFCAGATAFRKTVI